MDYIHKWKKGYMVGKQVNGVYYYFGNYQSIEKAKEVRDYFVDNNWDINERFKFMEKRPERYIRITRAGNYKIVKWLNVDGVKKMVYFGTFSTIDKAMKERDLLEQYNWDLELVCECSDEGMAFLDGIKPLKSTFTKHDKWNDWFTAKNAGMFEKRVRL